MSLNSILDRLAGQPVIPRRKKRLRPARFHIEALEARALLTTYTVTSTDPAFATNPVDHENVGLGQALIQVNDNPDSDGTPDVIDFDIPGGGVQTITWPSSFGPLVFNHPVTIDGTTQPGYITGGHPMIDLDGSKAGNDDGLTFKVGGNTVKGLAINNFSNGFGIVLDGTNDPAHNQGPGLNNTIQGNFIGTDAPGQNAAPNGLGGIDIVNSSYNLIGGVVVPPQFRVGNLISGNGQSAVFLPTATDTHNYIDGNYIGTDATGQKPIPNKLEGVALAPPVGQESLGFASHNFIGGVDPTTNQPSPFAFNVIAGNAADGVLIVGGSGNQVAANLIGIGADGITPVPNGHDGVRLEDASSNVVGGAEASIRNVISGNLRNGVEIVSDAATEYGLAIPLANQGASGNFVLGNYIGTDVTGTLDTDLMTDAQGNKQTVPLGNQNDGIVLDNNSTDPSVSVSLNVIGGDDATDGATDGIVNARNVISGNLNSGVEMAGAGVTSNTVEGNYIGTDENGVRALSNGFAGVDLNSFAGQTTGPSNNIIGGTTAGAGNVISGNSTLAAGTTPSPGQGDGVLISNSSNNNVVEGNTIGLTADGKAALPNLIGVLIGNAVGNLIGGSQTADANRISGNTKDGVIIAGAKSTKNAVQENLIGLDSSGGPLGNGDVGVLIQDHASGNFVGETQTVAGAETSLGNTIAANGIGVSIQGGCENNQVIGNLIGSAIVSGKPSTNLALANGIGVTILNADKNIVGGLTAAARNIIVNSIADGLDINDTNGIAGSNPVVTTGNVVEGNYIGIENDGVTRLANGGDGVEINGAASNTIGGIVQGAGNVISGNGLSGVVIAGQAATGNAIAGNRIGTTSDGVSAVITNFSVNPNDLARGNGVMIEGGATQNLIGLPGNFGLNVISGNPSGGVIVKNAGAGNQIVYNYIGLNASGTAAVLQSIPMPNQPTQYYGIFIASTPGTVVGAASFAQGGNVISGNTVDGILLSDSPTVGTQISGNYIGTDNTASLSIGNGGFGIDITGLSQALGPASVTDVFNNVVSGNLRGGIAVSNGASANQFAGNFIGTNSQASTTIPNFGVGIEINNAPNNTIGAPDSTLGNRIANTKSNPTPPSGADPRESAGDGILIVGSTSTGNHVENNALDSNDDNGVEINELAAGNHIGGAGQGNTIINNLQGIAIANAAENVVQGNRIGVQNVGTSGQPAGNTKNGILLNSANGNLIGTDSPDPTRALANVISANTSFAGILLTTSSNNNTVAGNLIGTNVQGAAQQGFGNVFGVQINNSNDNIIGSDTRTAGTTPGNMILGNAGGGVDILGTSQRNKIQGNNISGATGFTAPGGTLFGAGVVIEGGASNNFIGGPTAAEGNTISNNLTNGVVVEDNGSGNAIGNNLIFSNGVLGISLRDSAHNSQSPPLLRFATTGQSHRIAGTMTGTPNTTYFLQFFAGPSSQHADGSENDDAEKIVFPSLPAIVGTGVEVSPTGVTVTTTKGGVCLFDLVLPDDIPDGSFVRATATDQNGNTSQFSNAVTVETDSVGDGVSDADEAKSPSAGISTRSLVSVLDAFNNSYLTLSVSTPGVQIQNAWSTTDPDPNDPNGGPPSNTQFGLGFISFQLTGLQPGASVVVTMTLPSIQTGPISYWRYGPKGPIGKDAVDQWYNWIWDGNPNHTGAEIDGNTIKLHLVDGATGDDDITPNGIIVDPGAPGFPDPYTVTTTADSGPGSLRQAILNANAKPGSDITFEVAGSGPQTIQLLSPLPAITAGVTIDGSTEPGFAGAPLVVLDGSQAGAGTDGLTVASGFATIQDLVINHFSGDGVHVLSAGSALIAGNFIGTDASGKTAEGNGLFGVEIEKVTNDPDNDGDDDIKEDNADTDNDATGSGQPSTIDGGNVISGNLAGGISIHGSLAKNDQITSNFIGTQADGVSPLGNGGPGVVIDGGSNGNMVGSQPKTGNTVAFNTGPGVEILKGIDNLIESNSIFANQGLGIELASGGNANESQSAPVLASAASYGGETFVSGTLTSTPNSSFKIDFYATDQANQSGGPQGQSLLGSVNVTTDNNGQASFDATLAASAAAGSLITATASLNDNETSAFSAGLALTPTNPMVLIVNTGSDVPDADCGLFTLRQAIAAANANPGQDTIDFDLPNSDRVILPQSPLPAITDPAIIDGTSQPGYQGLPLVEIDGSQAGASADGLHITGGGSIVRGLAIHSFSGNGVDLSGPGGNVIEGDFLGTDVTGTSAMHDAGEDVLINGSPDNLIGGTTAAARNVILALDVTGGGATGNRIEGSYVGTDLTGTALLSDPGQVGVEISASSNTIGGLAAGAGNVIERGLDIQNASSNVVQGNLIGTDVTGTVYLSANTGLGGVGILGTDNTSNFSSNNLVGGTTSAARNIIAGGVNLSGADLYNLVQGNYIGTDITGTVSLGADGVFIGQTSSNETPAFNTIGGAEPGAGNLISGLNHTGISLTGDTHNNTIQGNRIGTDVTGTKALSNIGYGIDDSGDGDIIGGDLPGEGNLISGNETGGIILRSRGAGGDVVAGNLIGTDYTGTIAIGNGYGSNAPNGNDDGIDVGENNATIGGTQPGAGNVISDSAASGIAVEGGTGLVIQGNFIGTDVTGTKALGNRGDGITVNNLPVLNSVVGGTSPGAGNVISANGGDGIRISDPLLLANGGEISSGAVIQGNKIGTDVTGTHALGNAGDGISLVISNLLASDETIGGISPGAGNTIAFNGGRGVDIPFGNGNTVRGNGIFDNGGSGLITDINAAASTYAENRGSQLAQAAPVLNSAIFDPQGTVVSGTLTGTPFTRYDIDFFADDKLNATGFGDGQTYLQSISVLVDDTGSVQFQIPLDAAVPIGQWITATATPAPPPSGPIPIPFPNTSLFSQGVPVVAALDASDIQFSAPTYLVTESVGSAVIVVTRSGDTSGTAKVDYATHDGSAAASVNYTAETGTLTFAPSVASQTITVPVRDDGLADGNKDFQILLSNTSGANVGAVNTADVTVADSGSAGQIQFASPSYYVDKVLALQSQEQGSAPPSSFTLTRTGGEGTVSVEFRVTGGTAGNNMDYQDNFGTVIFAPGQTTAQITFGYAYNFINNNPATPVYRGPQTLQVTIGNPTGGAVLGRTNVSVLTIDDPADQTGAFEIKNQLQVKENAGQAVIEVDRLGQSGTTQEVSYSTVDGTAKAGTNYVATSGTLTFQPGQTQAEIDVPVVDDHLGDNPGTFQVMLSDPTGSAFIFGSLGQANVSILNSDVPPPSDILVVETINNAGNSGGFIENSGTALITVARVNPVTGQPDGGGTSGVVQVNYATSDGTAQAGSDYTAESGTLFFGPGQTYAHFSVPILPGHDFPDTRTFLVTLSSAVGDAVISADNPVTETIYGIPGQIDITSPTYTVAENKADLTVTITLNRVPGENGGLPLGNVTVDYATHDGTATAGTDYTAVSGTLTFSERDVALLLQTTITIPILNDQLLDKSGTTFDLTLSNPTGGPAIGDIGTTAITIQEDGDAQLSQVPSTTAVTSSAPSGSTYGESVTLTATVSATSGTPSGAVDFVDTTTGQDLGTVPLAVVDCDGEASLSVSSLDVGSHTIVAHYTGDTANLAVSQGSLTQLVTPATLTITADQKTMAFGTAVPGLTDTITGFVNGDTASVVSGAASLNTTATSTSGVGNYPITAGQGTLDAANYTFRIHGGTLSIVPAKLTLTLVADSQTMVYGSTVPALTDRIVGFVNGDTASVVSGAPSITTTATPASGVGTYPIDVSLGTLSATNYTFAFIGGTLTVTPAVLTVRAGSGTMVYGSTVPALSDTISGFVSGDTASVVTGAASLSTTATSASGVGNYAIMAGPGNLSAANYTFAFANGALAVTPAMLTVTADDKTRVYGAASPPLTDTIAGFVNRDTSSVVTGAASLSTAATSASGVGSYAITAGPGTLSAANYTFAFANGTLTVTPATLTVTADNKTMVVGATVPTLGDTISGFVNGDTSSVVSGAASLSTTATSASGVGSYAITVGPGTLSAANYTFAFVNGTLTVTAGGNASVLTLVHDAPAAGTEGSATTFTSTLLETTDSDSSVATSAILYTITTAPALGTLTDKGVPLAEGGSFSQQDINDGSIAYESTEEGADSFAFSVASDGAAPITGTLAITASDPAVVATGGFTYSATAGTAGSGQVVATFSDPGSAEALPDYAATIDWGDGTSATDGTLLVDPNTHVFTVTGAHRYAQAGTFDVAVTIMHETVTAVTVTSTSSVASATGTGEGGIAASGVAVSGYEFSALTGVTVATFTDTNVSLGASDFHAIIDWGDGTTSAAAVAVSSGGAGGTPVPQYDVTGSHQYLDEGQYTIKVSIEQAAGPVTGGTSATVSATATIHEERLANGTVGTPDQKYIQEIYRDLFGRQAEMQGVDFWVAELAQGVPRQQVAFGMVKIASFEEFQHDTVAALYEQYLGRAPDTGGLAYWSAYLYDGGTIEGMSQALVNSPEYWQKRGAGTVGGFLSALFHDALGRAIEPAAASYFASRMSNGWSAADVAAAVFTSDEYHRLRVNALFEQFVRRPADPGALAYFAGELDDGDRDEVIISQLLASDEYFSRSLS
jgi:hypothetical protein